MDFVKNQYKKGVIYMGILRCLVGVILILWILGFMLHIGGRRKPTHYLRYITLNA